MPLFFDTVAIVSSQLTLCSCLYDVCYNAFDNRVDKSSTFKITTKVLMTSVGISAFDLNKEN